MPVRLTLLEILGGRHSAAAERLGFVVERDHEEEVTAALVDHIKGMRWHGLDLRNQVDPAEGGPPLLVRVAQQAGLHVRHLDQMGSPYVPLEATVEQQRAGLSRNMKNYLNQHRNQLSRQGNATYLHLDCEAAHNYLPEILRLHGLRRGEESYWSGEPEQEFLPSAFSRLIDSKQMTMHTLQVDDKTIAAIACLDDGARRTTVLTGFDPDWYKYSPQSLLLWETIQDAIAHNFREVHLCQVDLYSKRRWGGGMAMMSRYMVYRDGVSSRYLQAMVHLAQTARSRALNDLAHKYRRLSINHRDKLGPLAALF
jgi:CelD/BcsL family acetyltransferase involved in cellulose biosynthesis